jgi:tRNA(Met) C34 N-acetyltransferase TmcA
VIDDTIQKLREKYQKKIEIQFIQPSSENTASILVVDKTLSLSVEI